jgi:hypothetical protein
MPNSLRYLQVRLRMERDKLVDWGVLANLSEDERTLSSGLQLHKHVVNDTLQEIKLVLVELTKLSDRHNTEKVGGDDAERAVNEHAEVTPSHRSLQLQKRAIDFIEKTRRFPGRIRWASFDKKDFEQHLSKLTTLNESMTYLFERHQRERQLQLQETSYMGILQANNKLDDLIALMASLGSLEQGKHLQQLTHFKALNVAVETGQTGIPEFSAASDTLLEVRDLSLGDEGEDEDEEPPALSPGKYKDTPVWVEWKYYEPIGEDDKAPGHVSDRISKLARLLRDENKPKECRIPHCLGYVHDQDNYRYGFVFRNLADDTDGLPLSLFDLLTSIPKPSLTVRVAAARAIATSLWYLHATNWLHKGLRSENVVLRIPSLTTTSIAEPFLAGFEYSRPADPSELTEVQGENRLHDLYRHPSTQFDIPRDGRLGFKKAYDIYSLGVVLYEIGMWRPVHAILGIRIEEGIRSATVKGVKAVLLKKGNLQALEAEAGGIFATAVQSCLSGDFVPGSQVGHVDESQLQIQFGERVVRKLDCINV